MLWLRTWHLATKSLLLHPLRSLLTVVGVFIGVASVIWLVAISNGISAASQAQFEGLGAENILIRTVKPPEEALAGIRGPVPYGLTRDDYRMLRDTVPNLKSAVPIRELRRQFRYGDRTVDGRLVGCTPEYKDITQLTVARGRFLAESDLRDTNNYCVLAGALAEVLFPYEDPIGRRVYLPEHQDYYVVVGVLEHRGATAAIGGSLDAQDFSSDVYIPIDTLKQRIGDLIVSRGSGSFQAENVELTQVTLRFHSVDEVERSKKLVEHSLAHHKQDIAVIVPEELIEQAENTAVMFNVFMGVMAAISLLVGGIGIMNIMLATVTERTREIGIRRALGACRSDIILQFLVETVLLSSVGGAVGVVVGFICPQGIETLRWLVGAFRPDWITGMPEVVKSFEPIIVPQSIPIAFGLSVLVGVVAGIYPAIRAANMDPIEALRHE